MPSTPVALRRFPGSSSDEVSSESMASSSLLTIGSAEIGGRDDVFVDVRLRRFLIRRGRVLRNDWSSIGGFLRGFVEARIEDFLR